MVVCLCSGTDCHGLGIYLHLDPVFGPCLDAEAEPFQLGCGYLEFGADLYLELEYDCLGCQTYLVFGSGTGHFGSSADSSSEFDDAVLWYHRSFASVVIAVD